MNSNVAKTVLHDLDALRKRKASLIATLETGLDALVMETQQNQRAIDEHKTAMRMLSRQRDALRKRAVQYLSGAGQIIEGRPPRTASKRLRTGLKYKLLDTSELRPIVSHRFQTGEVLIGRLQKTVADEVNGNTWGRSTSELVDKLYQTEDGDGFYTASVARGVMLNPLAIFTNKAHGRIYPTMA